MNYLAHAYLSFNQPLILTGNMISDHVKGKKMYDYESGILNGILLHRKIDVYTDEHPATKMIRSFFAGDYGLYSAVFTDVVYDYFLANDSSVFQQHYSLKDFSLNCYGLLDEHQHHFPPAFAAMYSYIKQHNWLYGYQFESGIENSFKNLAKRAKFMNDSTKAFEIFLKNKSEMQWSYNTFFPELRNYASYTLKELLKVD